MLENFNHVLGPSDSGTHSSKDNLAVIYKDQGRLDDVEELLRQLSDTFKQILGLENSCTFTKMSSLATFYGENGQWEKAEEL